MAAPVLPVTYPVVRSNLLADTVNKVPETLLEEASISRTDEAFVGSVPQIHS